MKKRTISKLKSIFGSKKSKRHHPESSKSSRSVSPEPQECQNGDALRPISRTPPPSRTGPPPSPPVPTHPIAPVPPDPTGPMALVPCPVCSRTFLPQSLAKHVNICEKMTVKKRKTFDSSRQRREGTDLEQYLPKNFGLPENSPFLEKSPPHTAKPVSKPKPSVKAAITKPSAELQRCPHCSRTFGMRAFERHVEWCADKAKILPAAPTQPQRVSDAKQRLDARTRYKAPPVRSRRTSASRDKSSNSRSASVESSRGVSPPRDYGDYRNVRRTSESVSSNDDPSPHVPVIRNARNSLNNSCGDAVKARQARLARDLSSTSKQEPTHPSLQKTNIETNAKKIALAKFRNQMDVRKKEQLKKLEEIARKYDERQQMIKEEKLQKIKAAKEKSLIPKKTTVRKPKRDVHDRVSDMTADDTKVETSTIQNSSKAKSAAVKIQTPEKDKIIETNFNKTKSHLHKQKNIIIKEGGKLNTESTMSLDSLDESTTHHVKNKTIGINTELLCPCVPCVIHDNIDQKLQTRRKSITDKSDKYEIINLNTTDCNTSEPKIEFLYKNLTMVSSCDIQSRNENEKFSKENISIPDCSRSAQDITQKIISAESSCNFFNLSKNELNDSETNIEKTFEQEQQHNPMQEIKCATRQTCSNDKIDDLNNLSAEIYEEDYERDMSNTFDDSIDNEQKEDEYNDCKATSDIMSRHGSGDTYTKFTENAADLEEFMNLTDKMIVSKSSEQIDNIERDLDSFHTPKTNSLEAIVENLSVKNCENTPPNKPEFSATFEELKSYFKALIDGSGNNIEEVIMKTKDDSEPEENRKVSDMEHITVYEINMYEQKEQKEKHEKNSRQENNSELKLPSINENNKSEGKTSGNNKIIQRIYKTNNKCKMLTEQDRGKKEYKTYIKDDHDSDGKCTSADEPPLKLPRIEKKRLDDTYDPFASAAKQMKELMSSETNIPKKLQSCSNSTRTLPILRPSREKSMSSVRADNTKMMKDSLNKTYQYQKTPTLQRMKSFGSTTNDNSYTFGSRCSSFRNNKKSSQQKLNTTFTKSSKENISTTDKTYFNRNSSLNRSFSSYTASAYSTPKPKEKIPKISTSMHHSFQRTTIKQPAKVDKTMPKIENKKNGFVNLDSILADDNSSMTDSNYIDPRLINENDNLPINVNTILNNPDIISSMESLLTTENLPAKFDSFNLNNVQDNNKQTLKQIENNETKTKLIQNKETKLDRIETNNNINNKLSGPIIDDISAHYEKIMSSLEQTKNIISKTSIRDDDSICEDFDLEEFIISFDDEFHKQQIDNKRTCSSTTRVVKQAELAESNKASQFNSICSSPIVAHSDSNGLLPINKSMSFNFSSNNVVGDNLFPSSVKRSTSLLESIQKKNAPKTESAKSRHRADQLERDIMQSLKDFDKFYESDKTDGPPVKETPVYTAVQNGTAKRNTRAKTEKKAQKPDSAATNGNYTPNGKSNDSAYSSLNRISPSKLSICNSKDSNGLSLDQIPAGSDSSGCQKDEIRSLSSEEFLAMERSAELDEVLTKPSNFKEMENSVVNDKHGSRASSRRSTNQWQPGLSSSGSEASVHRPRRDSGPGPRLSRFCYECGSKFPVDTAKFCIECGVKRLAV